MEAPGRGLALDRVQETLHPPGGATQALLQLETVYGPLALTTQNDPEQLYRWDGGGAEQAPPQLGSVVPLGSSVCAHELLTQEYLWV